MIDSPIQTLADPVSLVTGTWKTLTFMTLKSRYQAVIFANASHQSVTMDTLLLVMTLSKISQPAAMLNPGL